MLIGRVWKGLHEIEEKEVECEYVNKQDYDAEKERGPK